MIAPQAGLGINPAPSHDLLRANQLLEAGLWLHLGGDGEGARRLFMRALSHDPSNRRARELLAKASTPPPAMRPLSLVPPPLDESFAPVESQSALEVSVVLLDERPQGAPASAPVPEGPLSLDPVGEVATLLQGVNEMLALGDPSSAMALLCKAEALAPGDERLVDAHERCARELRAVLEARLGDLTRVPMLKLGMAELMRLHLDSRAGFLLSRLDGRLSCETLFSVSGMSRLETMRILVQLLDQDIITLR